MEQQNPAGLNGTEQKTLPLSDRNLFHDLQRDRCVHQPGTHGYLRIPS